MRKIITLFLLISLSVSTFAQNKLTLSGFVKEEGSLESLSGAIVIAQGTDHSVVSNEYGYYVLNLEKGVYLIQLHFPGSEDTTLTINLQDNTRLDLLINPGKMVLGAEVIAKAKNAEDVRISTHQLSSEQIKNIPALLGEKDVFKVIKLLPGVQKGQEGSSGFNVRGGGSDQNLIILDDAVVYNASHLFGFFSVFNGDALKNIELIKGGFPAKYGGRLSSVLNISMKDGDLQNYKGEVGLGLLSSRATFEGPIVKNKASFLISGRRSYADILASPLIALSNSGSENKSRAGYYFYDMNAKMNYQIDKSNKLFLSWYFGKDRFYSSEKEVNYGQSKASFGWGNTTGTLRWNHVFNPKLFSNLTLKYSNFNLKIKSSQKSKFEDYSLNFQSAIDDIGLQYDFSYYLSTNNTLRTGYGITRHLFRPNAYIEINNGTTIPRPEREFLSWEQNIYLDDEWRLTNFLALNLGLRGTSFSSESKTYLNLEPRFSTRILLDHQTSIKAGYTVMNQYMHLLSSTGVNLPTDLWVPATARVGPQKATQYSLGVFRDFEKPNLSLSVEGYYKTMNHIIGYKEGASFLSISEPDLEEGEETFEDKVTTGFGKSYGTEFMLQKNKGKFSGWITYTLSWTKLKFPELNDGQYFYPKYDRRHDINVVGFYELSPRVRLNALFTIASGNPITLPTQEGNVIVAAPNNGNLNNPNIFTYEKNYYSNRNEFRTEVYHRLDLGIQFIKERKKGVRTWELSVYNVYNRKNPFYYSMESDYNTNETQLYKYTIFPLIPSFTYSFKFN